MCITINTTTERAIRKNRNAGTWTTEIDVATLTADQRAYLAGNCDNRRAYDLTNDSGDITAASIQRELDRKIARETEQAAKKAEEQTVVDAARVLHEKLVDAYEQGADWNEEAFNDLPSFYRWTHMDETLDKRREAEFLRRHSRVDEKIAAAIDVYKAGGPRPEWDGTWAGSREMLDKIITEDRHREDVRKAKELFALADWIKEHGSERLRLAAELDIAWQSDAMLEYAQFVVGDQYSKYNDDNFPGEVKDALHPSVEVLREVKRLRSIKNMKIDAEIDYIACCDEEGNQDDYLVVSAYVTAYGRSIKLARRF